MNDSEDKLDELMAGYVLGNLSSEEAEELQQLLTIQPQKIQDLEELKETLAMMSYSLPAVEPPPQLWDSIIESIERDRQPKSTQKFQKQFSLISYQIASSIAALLVITLGFNNYQLRQNFIAAKAEVTYQKDVVAMLQNPETHLVSLKGMDMAAKASGRIIMTPGEPKSVLILQNLPVLSSGKYYQLWSIVNGKKVASGQFNANQNGTVLVKLPTPSASDVTGLMITLEAVSNSDNLNPLMVMTSSL